MNTLLEDVRFIILVHSRKLLLLATLKRFYVFNKRDDNLLQYQHVTYSMPTILRIVSNIQYTTIYFSRVTAAVHWKLQGSTSKVLTFLIHFNFFWWFFLHHVLDRFLRPKVSMLNILSCPLVKLKKFSVCKQT